MTTAACVARTGVAPAHVDPAAVFRARCEARAHLTATGDYDLHDAVDGLQADAVAGGLVDAIGQDAVQAIMVDAFRPVVAREDENAPPAPTRRGVPRATLDAADYLRRDGDADALRRWLQAHHTYLPGILEYWRHG